VGGLARRAVTALPVITLDEIRAVAGKTLVLEAVRCALIAHAESRTQVPPPIHLTFDEANGECHVKTGYVDGSPYYVIKVASTFYENHRVGFPSNSGAMLAASARTGRPAALLVDDGWLTAWRTAAAGSLITHALTSDSAAVGVLGTGLQARLQIEWLSALRPIPSVAVWGRRSSAASQLARQLRDLGLNAHPAPRQEAAARDCVITATASGSPLGSTHDFTTANHITAVGADMPGKHEVPTGLFAAADVIATDDHVQALSHGDFGHAVRAGAVAHDADTPVGAILRDGRHDRSGRSIADLTGVGAVDAAVASSFLEQILCS
jgi:ornithine cyclodeaminase/alanine dehydrogenase-like protein (mu-crystallin family)